MTSPEPSAYAPQAAPASWTHPLRHLMAALLTLASALLAALARRVDVPALKAPTLSAMSIEFYAEAGAPEGALYVNGELVGYLHGVTRL